jgi:hypothetical protein
MDDVTFRRHHGPVALVLACLVLFSVPLLSWATADDDIGRRDELEPAFESFQREYARTFKHKYRMGDYVVRAKGKSSRSLDRKSDTVTYRHVLEVIAPSGAKAIVEIQRQEFWGVVYPRDASLGEAVLDAILEEEAGVSLWHEDAEEVLLNSILSGSVTLTDEPGESWQIEAEQRPVPTTEKFGTRAVWGHGTLTDGVRTLDFVYRGASPWDQEKCVEMFKAQDERRGQCHRKVVQIDEDGELLAWKDKSNEYNFRVGLDARTRSLLLAVFEVEDR